MNQDPARASELDRTSFPELRERILALESDGPRQPRTYPGYPRFPLDPVRPRRLGAGLDATLAARRSVRELSPELLARPELSRVLALSHRSALEDGRGPVPSAGGLQALELYAVALDAERCWLPPGAYHYDRRGHFLAQVAAGASRESWTARVPSLEHVPGAPLLWVLVGDEARVREKYGARAERFLLLEAGHLMQNLALACASVGASTVPLGAAFEPEVARALALPPTDLVLYVGAAGRTR